MSEWRILEGDCRESLAALPAGSVQTCVTSPPYFGLRDYGHDGQIGLEPSPDEFVAALVEVFRAVRRVLRDDGTVWLNLGDSYNSAASNQNAVNTRRAGTSDEKQRTLEDAKGRSLLPALDLKPKDLLGIPWMVAFALRADGWFLRSDIIWAKPNPMPESVTDRPTKAHEYVFLLSKGPRYFYDADAIREEGKDWSTGGPGTGIANTAERYGVGNGGNGGLADLAQRYKDARGDDGRELTATGERHTFVHPSGRNKRSVWTVATQPYPGAHFATFPPKLIEPCILAGSPERACSVCGAPWERIVEMESRPNWSGDGTQKHDGTYYRENIGGGVGNDRRERRDLGFKPSCEHDAPAVPGTVLDPFAGAGTTGMVALRHNRSFIGCELNPQYVEIARDRIIADSPLLNTHAEAA